MAKTIAEINEKIKRGKAVVATADEIIELARKNGLSKTAEEVDVVTTGTFGPMCGSGAYFNVGHSVPRIKMGGGRVYLNDIPVYTGLAAVDLFLGATALPDDDPKNRIYPGEFSYGGGHVIEELVAGKDVRLVASAYGTDCYPRKKIETLINIKDVNEAVLFNVRNAYQNYNVAVNLSDRIIYTYMGMLKPRMGNANYSTAGQLSPLLNDPYYKTIGIGTRIFLGGGDLKQMKPNWLVGTSFQGYGATLTVGVGVPIPILNEEILRYTTVTDKDIYAPVIDYSDAFPNRKSDILAEVSYAELKKGKIKVNGQEIPTASLSSYSKAMEIANTLKQWIMTGEFLLSEAVAPLPGVEAGIEFKPLEERPFSQDFQGGK
jgi:uncharacterized protein (DUF39 family)